MRSQSYASLAVLFAVVLAFTACGGGLTGPSAEGVVVRGTVMDGGAAAATAQAFSGASAAESITVTVVEDPSITATVQADGSFTLRGLPEGSFTLVFTQGGTTLGTLTFKEVKANQEITITVAVSGGTVLLVEQRRNGIGHGDVEIEGLVEAVVALSTTAESTFVIDGHTVAARPGETSIREGNRRRTVEDVTVGRRVHVKGVWLDGSGSTQAVLAHEIKLQGPADDDDDDSDDDDTAASFCPSSGRKAEVEGKITAKGASDLAVFQQGKGDFRATVDGSTRIRKGNTTFTFEELLVGWRVHVSGTSRGLSGSVCNVDAREIKVQQN